MLRHPIFKKNEVNPELEFEITNNPLLYKSLREKGKSPLNVRYLVSKIFKDGSVMFRRSAFRTFITIVSEDGLLLAILSPSTRLQFERASNMLKNIKGFKADQIIAYELERDPLNILIRLAYRYNRAALELFFYNEELSNLFYQMLPELKRREYQV